MPSDLSPLAAFLWMFQRVLTFDGARYAIGVSAMFAVIWIVRRTRFAARKIQARQASAADMRRELKASLVSIAVYAVVATPTFWAVSNGYLPRKIISVTGALQVAGYVLVLLIAHDAWFYWTHRAMHHRRLFKTFHRLHHRSVTPTPFAAYAFNATEAVVEALFVILWINLIPTPWLAIFLFLAVMILRNVQGHSGYELMPSWHADHWFWGLFTTTTHHDLHHAGRFDRNFGLYFTWWDRMMGTEHPRYCAIFHEVTGRTALPPMPAGQAALAISR